MYSRKAGGGRPRLETWGMRVLVVYTALRLAGWTTGWLESYPQILAAIAAVDYAMLAIPLGLLVLDLATWSKDKLPKTVYLSSVGLLYGGLLVALNARHTALVASLSLAGAVFHATEYLAIVTHYAWRRKATGSAGLFQRASQQWLLVLLTFLVGWGLFAYAFEQGYAMLWAGVNFWAAALHYAYDGLIWKLRLPATAQALGVDVARPVAN
jgi:hypothetical protein